MTGNPYVISTGPPKMLPSFVCYADILGYERMSREALETGKSDYFLHRIRKALSTAYDWIRERSRRFNGESFFDIKVFTDNIVVGYPLDRPQFNIGKFELGDIMGIFSELQVGLASEGFFIRGGIAYGDHYMDKDIVFGDALLKAVNIEKRGGPPRISLDSSVLRVVRRHFEFESDIEFSPHYQALFQDADGAIFLNYLSEAFHAFPEGGIFFDLIKGHKQSVIKGLEDNRGEPGIRAKFEWAARYHNFFCREFANNVPLHYSSDPGERAAAASEVQKLPNYVIDIEELAPAPSFISLDTIEAVS